MVVVQRWYRERLVGDATTTTRIERERERGGQGVRGGGKGVQYDIINCSTMPPACRHGGHEGTGAFPWSRPIARSSYGGNFIKWILIDAVLKLTI